MSNLACFLLDRDNLSVFGDCIEKGVMESFDHFSTGFGAIIEEEGEPVPVGALILKPEDELLSLEWIFVKPEYRRRGIGTELLRKLSEAVFETEEIEGILAVLSDKNGDLKPFFDSLGFLLFPMEDRAIFSAKLSEIKMPKSLKFNPLCCKKLSEVPSRMLRSLEGKAIEQEDSISLGVPFPIRPEDYSAHSYLHLNKEGEADGVLLMQEETGEEEPVFTVSWLYSRDTKGLALAELLSATVGECRKEAPEASIHFTSLNQKSFELGQKLFPVTSCQPYTMAVLSFTE